MLVGDYMFMDDLCGLVVYCVMVVGNLLWWIWVEWSEGVSVLEMVGG